MDPAEKLKDIRSHRRAGARGGQSRLRLHRRPGVHHGQRRPEAAHHVQGSSRLAAAQHNRAARHVRRRRRFLGPGGRRRRLDQPLCREWRKIYMERVRQIAATGIDGIYVDIPYWMTHFEGWEDSWASFDDYTVAAFKSRPAWTHAKISSWATSPMPTSASGSISASRPFTDFMQEIDRNTKSVNPKCMSIAEIYPGIEQEAVRWAPTCTALRRGGRDCARVRIRQRRSQGVPPQPVGLVAYMAGMYTFRAFARAGHLDPELFLGGREERGQPGPMKNLSMSEVMAGANFWDAPGHGMSGSNDLATRKVFAWIAAHEKTFYRPRGPIHPVGVYFSPATRNYYARVRGLVPGNPGFAVAGASGVPSGHPAHAGRV